MSNGKYRGDSALDIPGARESGGIGSFLVCLLVHMTFPLLPLLIERFLTQDVSVQSLTIATAMYAIGIGASSRVKFLFCLMLGASILFSAAYGFLLVHPHAVAYADSVSERDPLVVARLVRYAYWVIGGVFFVHGIERFNRHVINDEPFL